MCFSQKSLDFVSLLPYNVSRDTPNCADGVGVVLNNIDMKCGKQAYDKSLFERTIRLYIDLWGGSRAHAINEINGTIDDYFKMYK